MLLPPLLFSTAGTLFYDELVDVHQVVEQPDGGGCRAFCTVRREKMAAQVAGWASLKPHLLVRSNSHAKLPPLTTEDWYVLFGRSEWDRLESNGEVKLRIAMDLVDRTSDPHTHVCRPQHRTGSELRHAVHTAPYFRDVQVYDTLTGAQRIHARDDPRSSKHHFEEECAHHAKHSFPAHAAAGQLPPGDFQICVHLGGCRNVPTVNTLLG